MFLQYTPEVGRSAELHERQLFAAGVPDIIVNQVLAYFGDDFLEVKIYQVI